jgi:hypothetical protein
MIKEDYPEAPVNAGFTRKEKEQGKLSREDP